MPNLAAFSAAICAASAALAIRSRSSLRSRFTCANSSSALARSLFMNRLEHHWARRPTESLCPSELRVLYCTDAGWPECYPYRGNGESHDQTSINEQSRYTRRTRRPSCWTSRQATRDAEANREEDIDTGRAPTEQVEDGTEGEGKDSATDEGRAEGERGDGAKDAIEDNAEASTKDRSEDRAEEEAEARPRARSQDGGDPQDVESTRTRRRRRGEGGARHTRRHVEG
jgi:hypothetical protein